MAIELYTLNMKGVDLADQLLWYKITEHRKVKVVEESVFLPAGGVHAQCMHHLSSTTSREED